MKKKKIWVCKIGEIDDSKLPVGSDLLMRQAVKRAYFELTGEIPDFLFSGWGGELNDIERSIAEVDLELAYAGNKE